MSEIIQSVGIDMGTTTLQVVFSVLTLEDKGGGFIAPHVEVTKREVTYAGPVHLTPLLAPDELDMDAITEIVREEYARAGIRKEDVSTGAVIITGETARKKNARAVLQHMADFAGDFVVAAAGPDLESVLAARGAGTDLLSEEQEITAANLDIGGGTTNIAVYRNGTCIGVSCLDIGGRLVRVTDGKISGMTPEIQAFAEQQGMVLHEGNPADPKMLMRLCRRMADRLACEIFPAAAARETAEFCTSMITPGSRRLPELHNPDAVTFSGGVADCMRERALTGADMGKHGICEKKMPGSTEVENPEIKDEYYAGLHNVGNTSAEDADIKGDNKANVYNTGGVFRYGDIGCLLGRAIRENPYFRKVRQIRSRETIRATVVGAGVHTTEVSGSTICYDPALLPLRNIPVVKIPENCEKDFQTFGRTLRDMLKTGGAADADKAGEDADADKASTSAVQDKEAVESKAAADEDDVAVCFSARNWHSFRDIQTLAETILEVEKDHIRAGRPLILIMENDLAQALGNALSVRLGSRKNLICIDSVAVEPESCVDIGEPLASGSVLPVICKTLVFRPRANPSGRTGK